MIGASLDRLVVAQENGQISEDSISACSEALALQGDVFSWLAEMAKARVRAEADAYYVGANERRRDDEKKAKGGRRG